MGLPSKDVGGILALDPVSPELVYVGTYYGVFKTTDGGDSWVAARQGLPWGGVSMLAVDPALPSVLYAGAGTQRAGQSRLSHTK